MIEILPGILWLSTGDDIGRDALRSHGVSVLVTDRDDLAHTNVLRLDVKGEDGPEKLGTAIARLYTKRVCAAVCVNGIPHPRAVVGVLMREVAGVRDTDLIETIAAANYPAM